MSAQSLGGHILLSDYSIILLSHYNVNRISHYHGYARAESWRTSHVFTVVLIEASWRALGELLEGSWRGLGAVLEGSWGSLGAVLQGCSRDMSARGLGGHFPFLIMLKIHGF